MSVINDAVVWFNDPLNWTNPGGILERLGEHIEISVAAVLLGCAVAWPLGILLGRRGAASGVIVLLSNLTQAVPVIALLTILTLTPLGLGKPASSSRSRCSRCRRCWPTRTPACARSTPRSATRRRASA